MNNAVDIILDAIRPTKSEPSVTYTIPNGAGGDIYVKMPRLFVDLGDDLERWCNEKKYKLRYNFYLEFHALLMEDRAKCGRVIKLFIEAWSHEEYYKFLFEHWRIQEENYQKESEEANVSKYWDGIDWGKVAWCQKKLEENRILQSKTGLALYFIRETKSIIMPHAGTLGLL